MYIQITTKCNMSCAHCGMNCTSDGENMSLKTFKQAIAMSGDLVVLGGGEPTIHPQFHTFLFHALANVSYVHIITNGKETETALALSRMSNKDSTFGSFVVELSQDDYHDEIDPDVVRAFKDNVRDTSKSLVNAGRCDFGVSDECICDGDPFVKPDGKVYQCGCEDSPCVGNVFDGFEPMGDEWICHKNIS